MAIKNLHFVGIGGSGISGVASLAEKFGYNVTGCDLEENTAYGKHILKGHSVDHIKNTDLVIVSPALLFQNSDNPEIVEAKKQKKLVTWEEFLGRVLLKDKKLICVAGTHGKSTTTAMAGKLLIDNGFDPVVVVGAKVSEWNGNSRYGKGKYAVVEADEFNNNFLFYNPDIAIINNIEFDHPDFFKNESEVRASFDKFIGNLRGEKILITQKDSQNKRFNLKLLGEHNQKNANMVYVLGRRLGIKEEKIIESIESFSGIGRRLEQVADRNGIKVYDDYAHHPTAIKTTLEGLRNEYPKSKILVIIEPHGYKRTKALLKNYNGVFDNVNKVIVGPIFPARDEIDTSITPELVAKASDHKNASGYNKFEDVIENCKLIIGNYDVVVVMGAGKSYLWAKEVANLLPVSFSDVTTFKVGGEIKKYFEVKNESEIKSALDYADKNNLPFFILGGGSDILVSDKKFNGVVIKYTPNSILVGEDGIVTADAGASWDRLVKETVENGLAGLECLSGIPGTVGASPIQNIGAYGQELAETFVKLTAYDIEKRKFVTFDKKDCKFGYRESIFKQPKYWQKFIITKVTFKLQKGNKADVEYESLKKYLTSKNPTLSEIRDVVLKVRSEKLENPKVVGNAGSFFKNPIINILQKEKIQLKYPDAVIYPFGDKYKISAAWLIENTGWKGKEYKSAAVSSKHALILINKDGKSKAEDVLELSDKIISDVYKKFAIKLEREVQLINF